MFKNPDRDQAMENLKKLAARLNVALPEIPRFLEDYSDIFLSLAYFKNCLDTIAPSIREFLESMEELRGNFLIKNDTNFVKTSLFVENNLNNVTASITGRLRVFSVTRMRCGATSTRIIQPGETYYFRSPLDDRRRPLRPRS